MKVVYYLQTEVFEYTKHKRLVVVLTRQSVRQLYLMQVYFSWPLVDSYQYLIEINNYSKTRFSFNYFA